jgi:hypothetical protein
MAAWNDAWFGGASMPPNHFPKELIPVAQTVADEWLFDARFRCILEEWVSRPQADEVMGGLLWSGFLLRGQPQKRVAPKPVLVRLLFTEPYPVDSPGIRQRMRELFARAVREWIQVFERHGKDLRIAP